jgi:nucleoside-diphosphate kinase
MSAQQHQDPAIYKHLSPKTQGFLRASAEHRFEAARLNDDTMSNEQTYVAKFPLLQLYRIGGVANFRRQIHRYQA